MRALAPFVVALLATPAFAQDAPVYAGVWQGTVGDLPVRVCLDRHNYEKAGGGFGAYYYLRHMRLIPIEQQADSRAWNENPNEGKPPLAQWLFDTVSPTLLTARFTQGSRALPVRLTPAGRIGSDEQPCGTVLFNRSRLPAVKVKSTTATKDGVAYTKLALVLAPQFADVSVETFALPGRTRAIARVNALLRGDLDKDPEHSDWFGCIAGQLNNHGSDGDYGQAIEPTFITPHWLATSDATGFYCGGPHPDDDQTSHLYDLDAGAEVDLYSWLGAKAIERDGQSTPLRPAFRDFVIARSGPIEAECREAIATQDYWDVGASRIGLAFTPSLPHVMSACKEPILVRFDRLAPWLSARGRGEVARFRASLTR